MDVIRVFSMNLKKYRTAIGLSQEAFADTNIYSAIECGKRSIALDNVQKIADALEIDTYLLFIDGNSKDVKEVD